MSGLATARGGGHCAALFAVLVTLLAFNTAVLAQADQPDQPTRVIAATEEQPFGLDLVRLADGGLIKKWRDVQQQTEADMNVVLICAADPLGCTSAPALQFLALVEQARERDGLARLGETNRSVNMSVRFMSDLAQHGQRDLWSSPLQTIEAGNGDCEDYAILKLGALRMAGVKQDDLRLAILRNIATGDHHAVAVVRIEGAWRILDNQRLPMLRDWDVTGHRPAFLLDAENVHAYVDPNIALTARGTIAAAAAQSSDTLQRHADATAANQSVAVR